MSEMQLHTDAKTHEKVWDMIKDIKTAMACTHGEEHRLHARPMMALYHNEATGELVFFTRRDSRVHDEVEHDQHILLNYANPEKNHYVAVTGVAETSSDLADIEKYWTEGARVWFPDGPKDPNISVIRVYIEMAEYWDAPSSAFAFAFGYAKARLTGTPPHLGEVGKVAL